MTDPGILDRTVVIADFSATHPDAIVVKASVAEPQQVESFFDQVETAFGGLDVVRANAGTGGPAAGIEEMEFDDWHPEAVNRKSLVIGRSLFPTIYEQVKP